MAFAARPAQQPRPADPVELFGQLAGNAGGPTDLWLHQGLVLQDWHSNFLNTQDVAVELPTGKGKTLVGGLIGEFRRRTLGERIAYVCPTRQLARQSFQKLSDYGIPATLLIGPARNWNSAEQAKYNSAQAIVVSVYQHIFNSNSGIANAQCLILDDAHAAEGAVAGPWNVTVARSSPAYQEILEVIEASLDPLVVAQLRDDRSDGRFKSSVHLASPLGVAQAAAQVESVLDEAKRAGHLSDDAKWALSQMAGHLSRSLVYVSYGSIQIRPLIAPTITHSPFAGPNQRIYMSATLGAGGELERSFGRRSIARVPLPEGTDRKGSGQRLFIFPEMASDLSSDQEAIDAWVGSEISAAGRVVVMTPDNQSASAFESAVIPQGVPVLHAVDIEDDLAPFTASKLATLVLSNRYDGLDLPDEDCRLVVLTGLPARGDLQERFFQKSLGATEVLQERVRARIEQGSGRATRNSGDYAVVVMLGADLVNFVTQREVMATMHPELHAEVEFGFHQSLANSGQGIRDNMSDFLGRTAVWRQAEIEISTARDGLIREAAPTASQLANAVKDEVAAWEAAWRGDWDVALTHARNVIDALRGGQQLQRYAALWHYLAACWAAIIASEYGDLAMLESSRDYFRRAKSASRGTLWMAHLASPADRGVHEVDAIEVDPLDLLAARNILASLQRTGHSSSFASEYQVARSGLIATAHEPYESALVYLGSLAGASESYGNGSADAAPDATWIFDSDLWVCWEAKSEADPAGQISADSVRQADGHLNYVRTQRAEAIPSGSLAVLNTPQVRLHPAARAVAGKSQFLVSQGPVLLLFDRLGNAWKTMRSRIQSLQLQDVVEILRQEQALPTQWYGTLSRESICEFPD